MKFGRIDALLNRWHRRSGFVSGTLARASRKPTPTGVRFETLEPRLLLSADLALGSAPLAALHASEPVLMQA